MLPLLPATFGAVLLTPALAVMPAVTDEGLPAVDDAITVACAYSTGAPGWAAVDGAPPGTSYVVFTMRTGILGEWGSADITSTSTAPQWWVETGIGMSFVDWVTFYSDEGWIGSHLMNIRCEGTPAGWPT